MYTTLTILTAYLDVKIFLTLDGFLKKTKYIQNVAHDGGTGSSRQEPVLPSKTKNGLKTLKKIMNYFYFNFFDGTNRFLPLWFIKIGTYTVFPVRWDIYFQANRVEHQKLSQTKAELSFG